ncbi:MAG: hemolysin family protein [Actinomycetota bacterium]|nr:hemolysin family protein [Actinomycetota bacterium]
MTTWKILSVLLLVGANAFFVAAEFALVAVRKTRIKELVDQGNRRAVSVDKALRDINLILSGTQLGITFASLGLGAIGEPALALALKSAFNFLSSPFDAVAAHSVAAVVAFAIITFLHVVLGELVPKNAAISAPEAAALWLSAPIRAFTFLFRPLLWLLRQSSAWTLKVLRLPMQSEVANLHTPDELAIIIEEGRKGGTIEAGQSRLLARTLEFPEKRAVEAMVPRVAAEAINSEESITALLDLAENTGYSRFPVWTARPDEFVGVVHLKDMLRVSRRNERATVGEAMREAVLVPESAALEEVLIQMRRTRNHFAIVLDEFGSTAGILTLEDILEELIGEIRDEYDVKELVRTVEGGVRIPGTMRPDELLEATGCRLPEGEYETVAGFILERLGRLAKRGDTVELESFTIKVANVRQRRILSVDVRTPDSTAG